MTDKHRWTPKENEICCEEYVKHYILGNASMGVTEFVDKILKPNPALSKVPVTSLRMKVSNTRVAVLDLGLVAKDSFQGVQLENYSNMHFEELKKVLKRYQLI